MTGTGGLLRKLSLIGAAVTAFAVAGVWAAGAFRRSSAAIVGPIEAVDDYGPAPSFTLTDAQGRRVASSELNGPWVANFIFTSCSRQCPVLTGRMNALKRAIEGIRLVSFSVDHRDTPDALGRFARFYQADWLFLTGAKGEVGRLISEGFHLPLAPDGEAINHPKSLVLIDRAGRIRGYFDGTDPSALEALAVKARAL